MKRSWWDRAAGAEGLSIVQINECEPHFSARLWVSSRWVDVKTSLLYPGQQTESTLAKGIELHLRVVSAEHKQQPAHPTEARNSGGCTPHGQQAQPAPCLPSLLTPSLLVPAPAVPPAFAGTGHAMFQASSAHKIWCSLSLGTSWCRRNRAARSFCYLWDTRHPCHRVHPHCSFMNRQQICWRAVPKFVDLALC